MSNEETTDILVSVDGNQSTVSVNFTGELEVVFFVPVGCEFIVLAHDEDLDVSFEIDDTAEFIGVTATAGDDQMSMYVNGAIVASGNGQIVTDHLI